MANTERPTWENILVKDGQEAPKVKYLSAAAISALRYEDLESHKTLLGKRPGRMEKQMKLIRQELEKDGYKGSEGPVAPAVLGKGPLRFAVVKYGDAGRAGEKLRTMETLEAASALAEVLGGEVVPEVDWQGEPRRFFSEEQIKQIKNMGLPKE